MSNVYQSAYKQFHFTETALWKVHNDIALNMDTGEVRALTLLDLSASFDTIAYSVLLDHLSDWYGISATLLTWIRSFLINRFQSIKIRKCFSKALPLFCGVPQGSLLGPLLFTLYTTPLSWLIHSHKLYHHLYGDDTQVYISLSTTDTDLSLKQLGDCLRDISGWMTNNSLRLNADETDFIIIGTSRQRSKLTHFFIMNILIHSIIPSDTVHNIGVTFDSDFNFRKHVSLTCHSCFYHIRDPRHIRRYISLSVAKTIATALITSRLDNCNSFHFRTLHLSGFHFLSVPRVKTHAGTRVFSVVVPTLWNSLSEHVKSSTSIVSSATIWKLIFSDSLILPKFPLQLIIVEVL